MPLTNGSTPMKPVAGSQAGACSRCSPPPKPISSRTCSTGAANSAGRSCRRRQRRGRAGIPAGSRPARRPAAAGWSCRAGDRRTLRSTGWASAVIGRSTSSRHMLGRKPELFSAWRARVLERLGEVGLLPRERAVAAGLAAEMAVGGGLGVDRLVQVEMPADAATATDPSPRAAPSRAAASSTLPVPCRST